jgi:hypothetical protein
MTFNYWTNFDLFCRLTKEGINWIQLILVRLCDLPQLVGSLDTLSEKLLDLLESQPPNVISVVVASLPGILGDSEHGLASKRLL